jgi:hypothetical protein
MSKVFTTQIAPPDFNDFFVGGRYDPAKDDELTQAYLGKVKADLVSRGYTHALTGEVVRFGVADGRAQYMVAKAGRKAAILIHLPLADGYQIPAAHAKGLTDKDLRDQVEGEKRLARLFAAREAS